MDEAVVQPAQQRSKRDEHGKYGEGVHGLTPDHRVHPRLSRQKGSGPGVRVLTSSMMTCRPTVPTPHTITWFCIWAISFSIFV